MSEIPLPLRGSLVGVQVSITDYAEVTRCVMDAARAGKRLLVTALAVHSLMEAQRDPQFAAVLNAFDIATPDGQPVRWGLRWTGQAALHDRVYGPTMMLEVLAAAEATGQPVYFYGGRADTLDQLRRRLGERFPKLEVAGQRVGRFRPLTGDEIAADAEHIRAAGNPIVFVGMGAPRQEWWIFHMRHRVSAPMLAVGAAFDFHAGRVSQAPPALQRHGLEWLYRLSREPRRLWQRYLLVAPRYLPLVAAQALRLRQFPEPTDLRGAERRACPG